MRIGICGAGVGGLSAGIGLKALGHDVEVFERSPALRATGTGLMLWPNGVRAIYGLGLRDQFDAIAVKIDSFRNYDSRGKLLFEKDTGDWPAKYGAPVIAVNRWTLSSMLAEALGADALRFDHQVVSAETACGKARAHFSNGTSYEGDVLIAADGIHSVIREKLVGRVAFYPSEHHAFRWRAIFDLDELDIDPAGQTGYYDPAGWVAFLPIGNGKAYWFGSSSKASTTNEFIELFVSWKNTPIPKALRITPREAIIQSALDVAEGLPAKWTHGRITLLGDAAHPPIPDLAQGGGQALIDSRVLRDSFAKTNDIDHALNEYDRLRRDAAYYVMQCSLKGSYLGANKVDPIAVRYEREIEAMDA